MDSSPGETITGVIPDEGDEDWFAFEVEAGETINLTADLGPGSGLKFRILDPDGERVAGTRGQNGSISGGRTASQSGTYYLRVFHWTGDGSTDYSFEVQTYTTTDREPNENRENAALLSLGETTEDTITIGDTDWYAFEAEAGETINLTVDLGPGGGIRFMIVDPEGENLDRTQGSNTSLLGGTTARESGTHYVRVTKSGGDTGADYSYSVRTYTTTDNEPNENRELATQLSLNATVEDTISLGDADWYAVDLQEGDSISVSGTVGPGGGNQIAIISPDDRLNGTQLVDGSFRIEAAAPSTGTHYIRVTRNSFPGSDYTLDVRTNGTSNIDQGETNGTGDSATETASDDQDGGGLPFLLIALGLAVATVAVRLWHRKDGD